MSTPLFNDRDRRARNGRLALQALHRKELGDSGRRIQQSREAAQHELDRIAAFLPRGPSIAGMTMSEISQLTGLSRPHAVRAAEQGRRRDARRDAGCAERTRRAWTTNGRAALRRHEDRRAFSRRGGGQDLLARELVSVALGYYTAGAQTAFVMLTEAGVAELHALLSRSSMIAGG